MRIRTSSGCGRSGSRLHVSQRETFHARNRRTETDAGARRQATAATTEPRWVRWLLIGVALGFLGLFLLVPLVVVFAEALSQGWAAYVQFACRSATPGRPSA